MRIDEATSLAVRYVEQSARLKQIICELETKYEHNPQWQPNSRNAASSAPSRATGGMRYAKFGPIASSSEDES